MEWTVEWVKSKMSTKFDGPFFGIMNAMGDQIDPQSRLLLETTYEAIVDAGMTSIEIDRQLIYNLFDRY